MLRLLAFLSVFWALFWTIGAPYHSTGVIVLALGVSFWLVGYKALNPD